MRRRKKNASATTETFVTVAAVGLGLFFGYQAYMAYTLNKLNPTTNTGA